MPKRPGSPLEAPSTSKLTRYFSKKEEQVSTQQKLESPSDSKLEGDAPEAETTEEGKEASISVELSQLLSLDGLNTPEELDARFKTIASALFNEYRLKIHRVEKDGAPKEKANKDTYLQVMEMEFYLIMPGIHEDPFCHGSAEQEQSGIWYFHRSPQLSATPSSFASVGGSYRGGSRKGLDITLGSQNPNAPAGPSGMKAIAHTRGGILLRSVRNVHTQAIISGPSLLVDFILKTSGADSIETLVSEHWNGDLSAFSNMDKSPEGNSNDKSSTLSFVPISDMPKAVGFQLGTSQSKIPKVLRTPRIGLDLGHYSTKPTSDDPRVIFVQKSLRFIIDPHLLKVNGRPQTFIGLLNQAISSNTQSIFDTKQASSSAAVAPTFPLSKKEEARVIETIGRLGGFTPTTARNYYTYYQQGAVERPNLKAFCGADGKGVCQSPERLLKMFGILSVFGR